MPPGVRVQLWHKGPIMPAVGYHYCPSDPAALLPADGVGSIGLVLCFKATQRKLDPGTVLTIVKKGAGPSRRL